MSPLSHVFQPRSASALSEWYLSSGAATVDDSALLGTAVPFILSVRVIGDATAAVVTSMRSLL